MIIAIDFDGTIIEKINYPELRYKLKPFAREVINKISKKHRCVLCTSRYGWYKAYAFYWLYKNNIEIHIGKPIGKPRADIYIDDNNLESKEINWIKIYKEIKIKEAQYEQDKKHSKYKENNN